MRRRAALSLAVVLASSGALTGCGGGAAARPIANVPIPVEAAPAEPLPEPAPARETPPEPATLRDPAPRAVSRTELASGVELAIVRRGALPVVHVRLALPGGDATDGDATGAAALAAAAALRGGTARLAPRDVAAALSALGDGAHVRVEPDDVVIAVDVAREQLDAALALLGAIAREPRFDEREIARAKAALTERAAAASAAKTATTLAWRELYELPTGVHPYAAHEPLAAELARLDGRAVREAWRRVAARGATLVLVGDVNPDAARASADRAFGAWRAPERTVTAFAEATPPEHARVVVADRPRAAGVELRFATLGPARHDERWADARVLAVILGGRDGRLAHALGGPVPLATSLRAELAEVARGPVPLVLSLSTTPDKVARVAAIVADELRRLATDGPTSDEVESARRELRGAAAVALSGGGAIADELARRRALGLADDHEAAFATALAAVDPARVQAVAAEHLRESHVVIAAAGDAERVGPELARFGEVRVVDALKLERLRTLPAAR